MRARGRDCEGPCCGCSVRRFARVSAQVRSSLRLFFAIARLPMGNGKLALSDDGEKLYFQNSSRATKLFCLTLQLTRAALAGVLWIQGAEFLARTISLSDLIL